MICRLILLVSSENRYICGECGTEKGKVFLASREILSSPMESVDVSVRGCILAPKRLWC